MTDHLLFSKAGYLFRTVLILVALCFMGVIETACGSNGSTATNSSGPVHLTLWTWLPNADAEVNLFEQAYPNIKVTVVNAGQGAPEYTKLRTALKAGSGAPDDVLIEYQYLPTFIATGKLVDLSQYGANTLKNDFVPWTWNQVSQGSKVYAIPQDSAPLAFLYRKDIFDQYKIPVPTTWAEYAAAAAKLHAANPKVYMGDFAPNDGSQNVALAWQAGSRPFKVSGTDVTININDAPAMKVAAYWDGLIKSGVVAAQPDFNTAWYSGFANGTYASWIGAAWGPVFLEGIAAQTSGKWRVAPLPQWNAGDTAAANWGGATNAVTTQSAHPKEAAELAMWINDNKTSATMLTQKQFLFPTLESVLNDQSIINAPVPFYGNQPVYQIFADASSHVDTSFQWSPFQDYVYNQMSNDYGPVTSGGGTLVQGTQALQTSVVNYAKQQGFTVTNG